MLLMSRRASSIKIIFEIQPFYSLYNGLFLYHTTTIKYNNNIISNITHIIFNNKVFYYDLNYKELRFYTPVGVNNEDG